MPIGCIFFCPYLPSLIVVVVAVVTVLAAYFVAPKNPLKLALVSEPESSSLILKFQSLKDFL
jgi:hypothetical protein